MSYNKQFDYDSTLGTSNNVDNLSRNMSRVNMNGRQSGSSSSSGSGRLTIHSGGQNNNGYQSSRIRTNPGNNQIVKGLGPVAKKELPYKFQTFTGRPSPMVQETRLAKTFLVEANYFPVYFKGATVYQYDIQFRTAQSNKEIRKYEFTSKAFWYAYRTIVGNNPGNSPFPDYRRLAFNGVNILYSLAQLRLPPGESSHQFMVHGDRKVYKMNIKFSVVINLRANPRDVTEQMNLVTILDEVLTSRLTCLYENPVTDQNRFLKVGKSMFYTPKNKRMRNLVFELGGGLEALTGLHGAIKPNLMAGLLLNVDLSHSVFYKSDMNVVDFYWEIISNVPFNNENKSYMNALKEQGMNPQQRKRLEIALKGKTLHYRMETHQRKKTFKFTSIAVKAAASHFFRQNGRNISIEHYFYQAYGYRLEFPYLPCICVNKNKDIWAPMELVILDEATYKFRGKIPEKQLRTIVQKTAFNPEDRRRILLDMAAAPDNNNQANPLYLAERDHYMECFTVAVDRRLIKVNASLLPVPTLEFGEGVTVTDESHSGVWNLQNGATLKKIRSGQITIVPGLVLLTPHRGDNRQQNAEMINRLQPLANLLEVLRHFGVRVQGVTEKMPCASMANFDCFSQSWKEVEEWMNDFKRDVKGHFGQDAIPLVLYVFPYKCTTRRQKDHNGYFSEYAMIKYTCDVQAGVHSQGILVQTYNAMMTEGNPINNATAVNVAIKILGKIGATLYTIESNQQTEYWAQMTNKDDPTLILGIDVTHPGEQDRAEGKYSANSVACVVGNIDYHLMQFEASVRAQNIGEERTLNIKQEIMDRILAFERKNAKRPNHVVIYRDGVSESQFQENLYEEKRALEEACSEIEAGYKPTLTYIIVSKRHHTRLFPLRREDTTGKAGNLKPGTLVETGITTKDYFDFYLVSQQGPLGTSRPAHYYVLWDDWKPSSTFWQNVTYALTHSYVRCPRSISQPAPVMYAHLAAKRAKEYLMAHVHMNKSHLDGLSEYALFSELREKMQKNEDLEGMIFV